MADASEAPGAEGDLTGGDAPAAGEPGNAPVGTGGLAGLDGGSIAVEAASHGPAEGARADEADEAAGDVPGDDRLRTGPTAGEALGPYEPR